MLPSIFTITLLNLYNSPLFSKPDFVCILTCTGCPTTSLSLEPLRTGWSALPCPAHQGDQLHLSAGSPNLQIGHFLALLRVENYIAHLGALTYRLVNTFCLARAIQLNSSAEALTYRLVTTLTCTGWPNTLFSLEPWLTGWSLPFALLMVANYIAQLRVLTYRLGTSFCLEQGGYIAQLYLRNGHFFALHRVANGIAH